MLHSIVSKARQLLPQPSSSSHLLLRQAAVNDTIPLWGADKASAILTRTCIPVSLVGGTAVLYKAVLDHPSSTSLTPVALVYLVLLASQYAFQPSLSKRFIAKTAVKTSLTLTEELIKATLAVVGLVLSSSTSATAAAASTTTTGGGLVSILQQWQFAESLKAAGIPAALYAFQGILQYTAYLHLDAVTYNGLSQTKVLSSALACAVLLGQIPTQRQCLALGLLVLSTLIFQGTWALHRHPVVRGGTANEKTTSPTLASETKANWWFRGVLPCLGSTLLSGVAGALSQKGLQQTHNGGRNAYLYTLEVSAYSAVSAFVISLVRRLFLQVSASATANAKQQGDKRKDDVSLFRDWTAWTFLPVICKAMGGVLTALVHKHAGSVSKGFALTLGLVMSTAINDHALQLHQVLGTMLVMLSSWLHFSIPKGV